MNSLPAVCRNARCARLLALLFVLPLACDRPEPRREEPAGVQASPDLQSLVGKYYFGDGLGTNCTFSLEPTGRFSYRWRGCLGLYGENEGLARVEKGLLILKPEKPNDRRSFGTPTDFLPLFWGSRWYLVPWGDLLDFINEINQGGEPRNHRHGSYYLREGDWEKKVTGFPDVPPHARPCLLQAPIQGKIVGVKDREITIDLGRRDGIWKGMILTARGAPGTLFTQLRVNSVSEKECLATYEYSFETKRVEVGQEVSSRF